MEPSARFMTSKINQLIGSFDLISQGCAYGWVLDKSDPEKAITVQVIVGSKVLIESYTYLQRPDLKGLRAGFKIPIPAHCFKIDDCQIQIAVKETGHILPGGPITLQAKDRFSYFIDGFVDRSVISGWLRDNVTPDKANRLTVQLLEDDAVIASSMCEGLIDESGDIGRFSLTLPESVMDEKNHEFSFRCLELNWDFETREFQTPSTNSRQDYVPPPFIEDPIWESSLAGKLAKKQWLANKAKKSETNQNIANLEKKLTKAKMSDISLRYELTCEIAYQLLTDNEPEAAIESYRAAITIDPTRLKAYVTIFELLLAKGHEAKAEAWLLKAIRKLPEAPELLSRLDDIQSLRRPKIQPKVIAFYLPQFHPTPENDQWWGKGFTEWTNVTSTSPLFHGHLQPRRPTDLGYYDLRLPEAANAQFELARHYGIDAFCYYYYWFDGKRVLDRPLQNIIEGNTGPFPFCICWANEDWTRSWDGMSGEVLLAQNHSPDSDFRFIQDVAPLLKHPEYVRHEGKPILLIYRADKLATPMKTTKAWREWCRKEGIGELHLCALQSFGFDDPRPLGFDAAVEFPPHCVRDKYPDTVFHKTLDELPGLVERFTGAVYDYGTFADAFIKRPKEPYQLHPTCFLAWDNTARRSKAAHIFHNFSTKKYQYWLSANLQKASRGGTGLVFVNAWNEWAEGTVLEPDSHFGYGLLEATRRAKMLAPLNYHKTHWKHDFPNLPEDRLSKEHRIILVGHDAHAHGAQINLLHMARCLKRDFGMEVVIFLLEGGSLLSEYERIGSTIVLGKEEGWQGRLTGFARHYIALGSHKAICNTSVTGEAAYILHGNGYQVVSLVHELSSIIESHGLQPACWHLAGHADNIVFASEVIAKQFRDRFWPDPEKILIAPQGIAFNPYHAKRKEIRNEVLANLDWPYETRIILGCGYGDTRKGIDLFVQMAYEVSRSLISSEIRSPASAESVAFIWVGTIDRNIEPYIRADFKRLNLEDRFHITGQIENPARYFIAADLYALTSREDPFPSVVMEAFDAGLPVVAFDGGGGYVDIVTDNTGVLVPYLDVPAMSAALVGLIKDKRKRQNISEHVKQYCRDSFGYPAYMHKLLALLDGVPAKAVAKGILKRQAWYHDAPSPTITAIIPNYNYGRYLELRLRTILDQTLPPTEIIVLDDASTDYSLEIIRTISLISNTPIKIITNDTNTGNPFVQWANGLQHATGELVWIAEADDYCEPTLLETLANEMVDNSVVMAWSDSIVVDNLGASHGFEYKNYFTSEFGDYWQTHFTMHGSELIKRCLLSANVVPNASAVLFRRKVVDVDLSLIQQYRFSGDWWFWISLAQKGKVTYRSEALNYHRRHSQSVMGDVLSEGAKLISETLAFYHRVSEYKPEILTSKTVLDIFDRLEKIFCLFPKLQAEAIRLKEHPTFKISYQLLIDSLNPVAALKLSRERTTAHLLISDDALVDRKKVNRIVQCFDDEYDLNLTLICSREMAEEFFAEINLDNAKVTFIDSDKNHKNNVKRSLTPSVKSNNLMELTELDPKTMINKLKHTKNLISLGLSSHCAVVDNFKTAPGNWKLVSDIEFDLLLGNLPSNKDVTVNKLRTAIRMCTSVEFLGTQLPHALGRMALAEKKAIFRSSLERTIPNVSNEKI